MKNITKTIDVNAHIANINSQITIENGVSKAVISFSNLGYGVITAVKFKAKGYNTFNDIIQIDGKDDFIVIIQDIHIEKNAEASKITVKIPSNDIRKLDLEEYQICWGNGDVTTYQGKNEVDFELQELDYSGSERTEILALRDVFEPKSTYIPLDTEYGWICTCGRLNYPESTMCSLCHHTKSEVEHNLSDDGRKEIKEARDKLNIKKMEESDRNDKRKKKNKIIISSVIFLVFALVITIISITSYNKEMASREIFSSESEMREAMQGKWTYYDDNHNGKSQYIIDGDKGYHINYSDDELGDGEDIIWNPSKGSFKIGSTNLIVKNGGESFLNVGGLNNVYVKGGTLPINPKNKRFSVNDIVVHLPSDSNFSFSNIEFDTYQSSLICKGIIRNKGNYSVKNLKLEASFTDAAGKELDSDWTYVNVTDALDPWESASFKLYADKNAHIGYCDIYISGYNLSFG